MIEKKEMIDGLMSDNQSANQTIIQAHGCNENRWKDKRKKGQKIKRQKIGRCGSMFFKVDRNPNIASRTLNFEHTSIQPYIHTVSSP